jgi:pantoate--beta-alanine ligase
MMQLTRGPVEAMEAAATWRAEGHSLALVPTMGALHEGHLSLVRAAAAKCDRVAVSIFVNPAQFSEGEDLDRYPSTPERDLGLLEKTGVDLVFAPGSRDMYPAGFSTWIDVEDLSGRLCGAFRPGHFRGVATVCCILFDIFRPDVAVFGQKDAQQLAILKRMVRDLRLGILIVPCPIVREPDGLAMSSRNALLSPVERAEAPAIFSGLTRAGELAGGPGAVSAQEIVGRFLEALSPHTALKVQYAELVDPDSFEPLEELDSRGLLAVAVHAGSVRLIDNVLLERGKGIVEVWNC